MCKLKFNFKLIIILMFIFHYCKCIKKPNIVIILADDVGRNDFSLHGSSQIPTPNIDALAYNGIILNKHYTMHICTPSRAALLTGYYPIKTGLQGSPIAAGEPRSLPLSIPTIAEKLSEIGYSTHLIGKWHLGHQNRSVTPLGRGFETFLGYWSGFIGYFDYKVFEDNRFDGFDLHDGHHIASNCSGIYATDLFTNEAIRLIKNRNQEKPFFLSINHLAGHTGKNGTALEVPNADEAAKKFNFIENPFRRIYAEIITRLDESLGKIVKTLEEERILEDTIILFMSDNGAQTIGYYENHGSNWPLRGTKFTLYEGAVRNSAFIWSKHLTRKNYIDNTMFHIVDWFPTLYSAAGGNVSDLGDIDGLNQWPYLSQNIIQNRKTEILLNIDEKTGLEALISKCGRYKIIKGTYKNYSYDGYYGDSGLSNKTPNYNVTTILKSQVNIAINNLNNTKPLTELIVNNLRNNIILKQSTAERKNITCINYCLFDLQNDPTETSDISGENLDLVKILSKYLDDFRKQLMPQTNKQVDPKSNPIYCFDNYFTWLDPIYNCTL